MSAAPDVSIVVVAWRARDDVLACLESAREHVTLPYEAIVVDDGSGDGTAEAVAERFLHHQLPRVQLEAAADEAEPLVDEAAGELVPADPLDGQRLGVDPGLVKDGVEAQLQALLAQHIHTLGEGYTLLRREYPTAIGPVDILCKDGSGTTVAVEIKRRGDIDGVEQLTRYLELLNRDPLLAPVQGVFAAQEIKPQARVLATDRGIRCVTLDYNALRGIEDDKLRLF